VPLVFVTDSPKFTTQYCNLNIYSMLQRCVLRIGAVQALREEIS
jgi:hypothetical protein